MADRFAPARAYLRNADPVLAGLIDKHPDIDPRNAEPGNLRLSSRSC